MVWLVLSLAHAGELNFSPDRPGVGDATATVGAGAIMVEGGLAATVDNPAVIGTSGIIGRIGLFDPAEVRVRVPDVTFFDGEAYVGQIGLGAKVGGALDDHWAISMVPELFSETDGGAVGGNVGTNLSYSVDNVGVWVYNTVGVAQGGTGGFFGGGLSYWIDPVGIYVNGGHGFNGDPLIGGGGWLALSDRAQLDAGVDMTLIGGTAYPVVLFGASAGFD